MKRFNNNFYIEPSSTARWLQLLLDKAENNFNEFKSKSYGNRKDFMEKLRATVTLCNHTLLGKSEMSVSAKISLYFTLAEAFAIACQICLEEKQYINAVEHYERSIESCMLAEMTRNGELLNSASNKAPLNMLLINKGNSFKFNDIQQPKKIIYEILSSPIKALMKRNIAVNSKHSRDIEKFIYSNTAPTPTDDSKPIPDSQPASDSKSTRDSKPSYVSLSHPIALKTFKNSHTHVPNTSKPSHKEPKI